jgi:hypothetical protein
VVFATRTESITTKISGFAYEQNTLLQKQKNHNILKRNVAKKRLKNKTFCCKLIYNKNHPPFQQKSKHVTTKKLCVQEVVNNI